MNYMTNRGRHKSTRVLFIDHTSKLGGAEIALRNLLAQIDPDYVCATILLCEEGPLAEQLRLHHHVHIMPLNARVIQSRKAAVGLKSLLRVRELFWTCSMAWKMSRYIRKADIQVVHTNSLKSHVIGGLAARLAHRPLVWHMRDRIAADYLPHAARLFVLALCRVLPNFVIANSQATLDTLIERRSVSGGVNGKQHFRVIHDGCSIPAEIPQLDGTATTKIGLIGRISPWKGQHVFIKAAALIRNEFPDVQYQIIGAPLFLETDYESELKRLSRDLGMDDRVQFVGFVSDVQNAVARLEIVIHASTVGEPFGQVVIEGMAAGKPVIATRGGGIPEIVLDKITGLLVPAGDERALADAMRTLLREPENAREMGRRGRERVRQFFTIERTARAVEQVYRDVLDGIVENRNRQSPSAEAADVNR